MKKLIVIGIIALMITGLSVAANAYAGTVLALDPVFDGGSMQTVYVGWYTATGANNEYAGTVDTWDTQDSATTQGALDGQLRLDLSLAVSGMPAGSGLVNADFRAPNLIGDTTQATAKRWIVKSTIANNPFHVGGTFSLNGSFAPGFGPVGADMYIFAGTVTLANCQAFATAGTNYLFKLSAGSTGFSTGNYTLAAPTATIVTDPDTGEETTTWNTPAQTFTIYAQGAPLQVVPEPGSMVAMLSGLIGLVGFGIRRRK